jgi:hypothetical protein
VAGIGAISMIPYWWVADRCGNRSGTVFFNTYGTQPVQMIGHAGTNLGRDLLRLARAQPCAPAPTGFVRRRSRPRWGLYNTSRT